MNINEYLVGSIFKNKKDGVLVKLCQVESGMFALISIRGANRWSSPVKLVLPHSRAQFTVEIPDDSPLWGNGYKDAWILMGDYELVLKKKSSIGRVKKEKYPHGMRRIVL